MAIRYLDYEGGNDANDGSSFANRVKTITSGLTAARIAPGDVCRIMKSPDPVSLGINATWTNKSATITLASALNVLITDCDTAWTASANVTSTADTSIFRTTTKSAKHVIAAGFTTGLASYFATGTLDLSAYQGITLWVRLGTATLAASTLSIRLCSDAAGVTTVDTLAIPAITQTGQWIPVYIDKGSALGSSIASIALYADLDPGTIDVYLDNISTVKAAGNDALTLQSLVGKNTGSEVWWALKGINGVTLTIDVAPHFTFANTSQGYSGTTESVTTYKRETIKTALVASTTTAVQAPQDNGTAGNPITYSGGWNTTDMTTQTGETWFDGQSGYGHGIDNVGKLYTTWDLLCFVRYYTGYSGGVSHNLVFGTVKIGHCGFYGLNLTGVFPFTATTLTIWGCEVYGFSGYGSQFHVTTLTALSVGNGAIAGYGLQLGNDSVDWKFDTVTLKNCKDGINGNDANFENFEFGTVVADDNIRYGWVVDFPDLRGLHVKDLTCRNNGTAGLYLSQSADGVVIDSYTSSGNTSYGIDASLPNSGWGIHRILKSSIAEATKLYFGGGGGESDRAANQGVVFHNYNGVSGDHRFYESAGWRSTQFSETSVRHTASGLAWKISAIGDEYVNVDWPVVMPIGKVLCNASALVTVKIWLRRTNTGLTGMLRCRGGQIDGVPSDVTDSIGAAADTWEEQTITFTPTVAGVVEIDVACYGGTTYSLYVDDFSVSQA